MKAAQHVHILHHAVFGQQIDHRAEEAESLLLPDAHIHILVISAKDGVAVLLFHPDANARRPMWSVFGAGLRVMVPCVPFSCTCTPS